MDALKNKRLSIVVLCQANPLPAAPASVLVPTVLLLIKLPYIGL